jgi:hypothetical protein
MALAVAALVAETSRKGTAAAAAAVPGHRYKCSRPTSEQLLR